MRTIHSNWRTCVIHITHRIRKLMTNENTGCAKETRPAARSASVRTAPSDWSVRPSTSRVAAIAKTASVNASVRRADSDASGWVRRPSMRTA